MAFQKQAPIQGRKSRAACMYFYFTGLPVSSHLPHFARCGAEGPAHNTALADVLHNRLVSHSSIPSPFQGHPEGEALSESIYSERDCDESSSRKKGEELCTETQPTGDLCVNQGSPTFPFIIPTSE